MLRRIYNFCLDWLDERLGVRQIIKDEITEKVVPRHRKWHDYFGCFGGLSFVFFIIQVLSGIFLLIYYVPHPDYAYQSIQNIDNRIAFGWLVRRVHAVGANFMILLVMIHMLRVLFTGAYKKPRELHWVSGVCLLFLTLAMGFSGYLLPWTQLSYWAATVGTNIPGSIPFIGPFLVKLVRGGDVVDAKTLGRFFAMHVCVLPALIAGFMGLHFLMIRKTGISEPL